MHPREKAIPLPPALNPQYTESKSAPSHESAPPELLFNDKLNPPDQNLMLTDVIVKSRFTANSPQERMRYILREFNQGITYSAVTNTIFPGRGVRIRRDQFILAQRNNVPELVPFSQSKIARAFTLPGSKTEIIEMVNQSDPFYGKHGSYVINVPVGQYASALTGNKIPLLLGEGTHVIHDPTFKFNKDTGFIQQSNPYIQHGTIHILRIPAGQFAKVWIGSEPYLLFSRSDAEPYVFNSPLFKLEAFGHNNFSNASDTYIKHGTLNVFRIPAGKIAKVWNGSSPFLLESREQPYISTSPLFKLEPENGVGTLVNTSEKLIIHGSIKRITPDTSEVAIGYHNGILQVFGPNGDGKPIIIDSPTYRVESEFLKTSMQTEVFPSEDSKRHRKLEDSTTPPDEINYEVFTTKDGLKIGVKLLVAYEIQNPELVIRRLGDNTRIVKHIENLAAVDMGKVIQQRTALDFLAFDHTTPKRVNEAESKSLDFLTNAPQPIQSIQDTVKSELGKDLKEYGINLVRLNFETPKILNKEIADKMANQAILTTDVNTQEAAIEKQTALAQKKARQAADVSRVAQDQINQITVSTAQAKSDAAKLEAAATETQAKATANSQFIAAEMDAKSIIVRADAEKQARDLQGTVYREYPELLKRDLAQLQCDALRNAHIIVSPDQIGNIFNRSMGLTLFSNNIGSGPLLVHQQDSLAIERDYKAGP